MAKTKIEWCEEVWNPLTGCNKIGQGCKHCYAEKMAHRLRKMGRPEYQDAVDDKGHWTGKITLVDNRIDDPLHWKKPSVIFVNSMSDLFHKDVPQEFIERVFTTMEKAYWHKYQILTKRYDRVAIALSPLLPISHVWVGFSICNQDDANKAREHLQAVHDMGWLTWVSYEPALEMVDWSEYDFIDWMVCGGESGPGCRLFNENRARGALSFCRFANIKFFMKQMGGHPNKRDQMEDFPEDLRVREHLVTHIDEFPF